LLRTPLLEDAGQLKPKENNHLQNLTVKHLPDFQTALTITFHLSQLSIKWVLSPYSVSMEGGHLV
jgi:hypothetical protein